ncbi:hypothetical protein [Pelagicoccus sp. SDUM812003]|uniref:hypothetical protein n=1 Tax=Pelagicoccus sp. SDUM812003 TaxID=3041267 RepID=UPI00280DB981|nr:hypothetical protein [Pelagicoccus sp. SDUM812003]MDQ8202819.1 hypothetical protein [Pelagicoccus sp. SDUM812003]
MRTGKRIVSTLSYAAIVAAIALPTTGIAQAAGDRAELAQRVVELERELAEAKAALLAAQESQTAEESGLGSGIEIDAGGSGTLEIGGAVRVNYVLGDYPGGGDAPSRGGHGGVFELDTFRINMYYENGPWMAKGEYRFYSGYNFLHTGWLGYQVNATDHVEVGMTRVPFGAGPYGVSQSWFFDQHYYVGLADDMDLGVKYRTERGDWAFDLAYFARSEQNWRGGTERSARYSYDVVAEGGVGYEERNQVNLRAIRSWSDGADRSGEYGASFQLGELDGVGGLDDETHWAASLHAVTDIGNWKLGTQLSYYELNGVGDTTTFGAYDFPVETAAKAWVPAVSVSYLVETRSLEWLDSVRPFFEYSNVMKPEDGLNDSAFMTFGTAFARGPWYVYLDWVFSNGNEFVGGEVPYGDRLGRNPNDEWQQRINLNFGLYY